MPEYRVQWEIDVDAESPEEAAEIVMRRYFKPNLEISCFLVLETAELDSDDDTISAAFVDLTPRYVQ